MFLQKLIKILVFTNTSSYTCYKYGCTSSFQLDTANISAQTHSDSRKLAIRTVILSKERAVNDTETGSVVYEEQQGKQKQTEKQDHRSYRIC